MVLLLFCIFASSTLTCLFSEAGFQKTANQTTTNNNSGNQVRQDPSPAFPVAPASAGGVSPSEEEGPSGASQPPADVN